MNIRGRWRLRLLARRVRRWRQPRALILMYHRVADLATDPHSLAVTPGHFQEHLDVLCARTKPMGLRGLIRALNDGTLPDRATAVTFDDGYADNWTIAHPLLQRYGVPATVFVATGYLDGRRAFWPDELGRLLLSPGTLPERLRLNIGRRTLEWGLDGAGDYTTEAFDLNRGWTFRDSHDPSPRHRVYRSLYYRLRPLADREREGVLGELRTQARATATVPATDRTLRPEELVALADGGLVEVGAHTETHPVLAALAPGAQAQEIRQSKRHLEDALGREVCSFSYPYGSGQDYSSATIAAVREAGFACACTSSSGLAFRGTNLYRLPRSGVRDWDGERFAQRLEERFRGIE